LASRLANHHPTNGYRFGNVVSPIELGRRDAPRHISKAVLLLVAGAPTIITVALRLSRGIGSTRSHHPFQPRL
jgi:hypothetical protein